MTVEALLAELESTRTRLREKDELIATQKAELDVHAKRLQELLRENEALRARVDALCRRMYGRSSEKVDASQLALAFAELEKAEAAAPQEPETTSGDEVPGTSVPRRRPVRRRPSKDLERRRVEVHPPESERSCRCCGEAMRAIGEETSERYEYEPARCYVEEIARIKYACARCAEGVVTPPPPPAAIEKAAAGPGLVAQVITSKFADHLPLYRQEQIFARLGLDFPRSTLKDWTREAADRLEPIVRAIRASILGSRVIQSDDTPVTVLGGAKGSETGHLWVYVGENGEVAFDFTMNRSRDGPLAFLAGYRGFVQADAYSGYDALFRSGDVVEVGCWAHARRYFVEALATDPRAAQVLALVQRLYGVEAQARESEEAERLLARQERSRPLLQAIQTKLASIEGAALPKSPIGKAVTYAQRNWKALSRFTEQGVLDIDNNAAERALRAVAVGRKNWLFAGNEEAGHRSAVLMSLIGTCKLQGVEPFRYLRDVLIRRWTTPQSHVYDLTPRGWKQAVAAGRISPQL